MASIPLPNGAQVALASAFGAAVAISGLSNANPAVATTSTAHPYNDGDIVVLSFPSLSRADNQARRVMEGSSATEFILPKLDTTNTTQYPTGSGVGTSRIVTTWQAISKVPTFDLTGGDAKTRTTGYLDYEDDFSFITGTNPMTLNFTTSYQPDSAQHDALIKASDSGELQILRLALKDGSAIFYPGQLHFNPAPKTTRDEEMVNNVTLVLQGRITRFAKLVP